MKLVMSACSAKFFMPVFAITEEWNWLCWFSSLLHFPIFLLFSIFLSNLWKSFKIFTKDFPFKYIS